jgi:flagella basal body P-ring formation protein FlgA
MNPLALFPLLVAHGCLEAEGPRITAGLLKQALPELSPVDDAVEFGYSPAPGATRWIRRSELNAFAFGRGVTLGAAQDVCVVRAARTLEPGEVEKALARAVADVADGGQPRIEVVDFLRLPLPHGPVKFSRSHIQAAPDGALLVRGRIEYDRSRSVPVWAKARILYTRPVVFARAPIARGRIISEDDVEIRRAEVSLLDANGPPAAGSPVGMEALTSFDAGQVIPAHSLGRPLAVRPGDSVRAVSQAGAVRIAVEALALRGGRLGDVIQLETKTARQKLRARITTPGEARIESEEPRNETAHPAARGDDAPGGSKGKGGAETDTPRGARGESEAGRLRGAAVARQPL